MRNLTTLKGILNDFELGEDDFDAKIVWVPSKPKNQNDEKAMKEWKCKSNIAIVRHMQLLKDKGLSNIEFVVQEREKESSILKSSSVRKRYDQESMIRDHATRSKSRIGGASSCSRRSNEEGETYSRRCVLSIKRRTGVSSSAPRANDEEGQWVLDQVAVGVPIQLRVIPTEFKNKILQLGGSERSIKYVFRKALTKTDVDDHQGRLLIPKRQIENEFLTTEEKVAIVSNNVESTFIEPSCNVHCTLNVQKWNSTTGYQLMKPWNDVVKRNGLKAEMMVELWTFRIGSQLGLALVLVK